MEGSELMPLYEYYCSDCKGKFELLVSYEASIADDIMCTKCHGTKVRKLISVFARPVRSGSDDFGDFGDFGGDDDGGDFGEDDLAGGGCACGGSCSCNN
jgi:putative FmdB family regulatory protein